MREEVSAAEAVGPGITLGPWKVLQRLDSGSYGVVFLVERAGHPEAGLFALKLAKQSWDERFEREARLLQRCAHPGVARFEDMGVWTGPDDCRYPYIVTGTYPPPVTETESQGPRKVPRPRELATLMPKLDELIMRLLSEDRDDRGTARKTAEDLERAKRAAAQVAGYILPKSPAGVADAEAPSSASCSREPSRSRRSGQSTSTEHRRTRAVSAWISWASAATAGGMVAGGILGTCAPDLRHGHGTGAAPGLQLIPSSTLPRPNSSEAPQ